jgi:Lrp/AsnC family transcriptional regulator, leucine-responsive regulatory protein
MMRIDAFDTALLREVQANCRLTANQLSERVGLSPSAVQRRLDRLRRNGAIEREVAIVSPAAIGRSLVLIVEVSLENEHEAVASAFREQISTTPQITQCYFVTGESDYVLVVCVRDMEEYETLTQELFGQNRHVKRFITNVVMRTIKSAMQPAIESD